LAQFGLLWTILRHVNLWIAHLWMLGCMLQALACLDGPASSN